MTARVTRTWVCIASIVMFAIPALAQDAKGRKKIVTVEGITEYQYDNGLRVLLFPDPSKATVTVNVTYFVGSRHEGLGETGMAHLLEHMVFKGTPTYENIWGVLQDHGARFNGSTWVDRTNYFETLPAGDENLEFALKMEADRMINSFVRQSDLDTEMTVVRNEFEMGENDPMGVLSERMLSTAYLWHNYGKSTIGSKEDIERVPIPNLQAFYKKYYQPDNAMLVVAGKFEPEKCLAWIDKYFGSLPRPQRKLADTYTVEPVQDGERNVVLRRNGDVGAVGAIYHICAGSHTDYAALDALMNVLNNQPSGRLYKALVESGLAARVRGDAYGWAEPGVVELMAEVRADRPLQPVLDKMTEVVEGCANQPVTDEEVERAKARLLKDIDLALTRSDSIGIQMSEWAAMGDWRLFFIHRDRIKALKTADVQRVAAHYFLPSNRTAGMFIPTKAPTRSIVPEKPDVLAMVKDYKGSEDIAEGEAFEATPENIENRTRRQQLPVGLKLALLPKDTRGEAVRASMRLHLGTEADLKGNVAAFQMVPSMLIRGTSKKTHQQIRDELDRLQARVSANAGGGGGGGRRGGGSVSSDPGMVSITIETKREYFADVLKLVGEILMDPSFPADEFDILKKERLASLEQQLTDPQALAFNSVYRRMAPWDKQDVRYVPTIEENIQRTQDVTLDQVKAVYRKLYGVSNAELAIVGDFDEPAIVKTVETIFGSWKSPSKYERIATPYRSDVTASDDVIVTADKKMAIVGAGINIELRDDDPDYAAVYIGNHVLGGSAKSRLLNRLRHKGGLSYGAGSMMATDDVDRRGRIIGFGICATENADKATDALLEEMLAWHKEGITDEELTDAKTAYALEMKGQYANDTFVAGELARGLFTGRTFKYYAELEKQVQALDGAAIKKAIGKYFDPGRLVKVKAGDITKPTEEKRATPSPS